MANICLTTACNRDCGYCFARSGRQAGAECMSEGTFSAALDLLERSGIQQARLLGGEPTLHPQFSELAEMALARGFRLLVFSNGLMPEPALCWMEKQAAEHLAVVVNVAPRDARQNQALERLGSRVTPGFTIESPAFDPGFLLDLIEEFKLFPAIRIGLAHPAGGDANTFLHPRQYAAVGARLARFAHAAAGAGVRLSLDCGFVPCMFPAGEWHALGLDGVLSEQYCSPILDLLPDGRVIPCFPLAGVVSDGMKEHETAGAMRQRLRASLAPYRRLGIHAECAACPWLTAGQCAGGCLASAMRRLRGANRLAFRGQIV